MEVEQLKAVIAPLIDGGRLGGVVTFGGWRRGLVFVFDNTLETAILWVDPYLELEWV
jgi:hypothetical protein